MSAGIWAVLVVAGLATFAIRASSLLLVGRREFGPGTREVLRMIPAAALAALVAPAVLRPEGALVWSGPRPLAAALALVVAVWTRSIAWTIVVGLVAVIGLGLVL